MSKYSLEVEDWGLWSLERDFSNLDRAIQYGLDNFPQNNWRIFDRISQSIAHVNNPLVSIEQDAFSDIVRFERTEYWRNTFAERRLLEEQAAEQAARQRERMAEIASRQRQSRREHTTERSQRLRRFGLLKPNRDVCEKVNWIAEGF